MLNNLRSTLRIALVIAAVVATSTLTLAGSSGAVGNWQLSKLTQDQLDDSYPQVEGSHVAWVSYDGTYSRIRLHAIESNETKFLTENMWTASTPQISGDYVAWSAQDGADSAMELFVHRMSTEATSQLTEGGAASGFLLLDGGKIVWQDTSPERRLVIRNLAAGTQAVIGTNIAPVAAGGQIIVGVDGEGALFYDMSAGRWKRGPVSIGWDVSTDGSYVAWAGGPGSTGQILLHDIVSGETKQLTNSPNASLNPTVSNGYVVWESEMGYSMRNDVFLYDIDSGATTNLSNSTLYDRSSYFDGDTVVWVAGQGIRILEIQPSRLTELTTWDAPHPFGGYFEAPVVSGDSVVWYGGSGQESHEIYFAQRKETTTEPPPTTTTTEPSPTPSFTDVGQYHPYRQAILNLADREVIEGYNDNTFRPDEPVWRQHFAKMIVLSLELPVSEADVCPFGDVSKGGPTTLYPDNYIAVAAEQGITKGIGGGRFGPYNNITRAQVVTMSVRAASRNLPASATAVSVTQRWNAEEWEAVRKLLATSECSSR